MIILARLRDWIYSYPSPDLVAITMRGKTQWQTVTVMLISHFVAMLAPPPQIKEDPQSIILHHGGDGEIHIIYVSVAITKLPLVLLNM